MSLYSLENNSALNYYKKHSERILDLSTKEYINTYFLVGEKINKKEQQFSLIMKELLCTENCEIINYINDKLEGRLEHNGNHLEVVNVSNGGHITYNVTQVLEQEATWENTNW